MSDEIRIIGRRGGIEYRRRRPVVHRDPTLDAEAALAAHLAAEGRRERYWKGEGEFEPVFLNMHDERELIQEMAEDPNLLFLVGEKTGKDRKGPWKPFRDHMGDRYVKVIPLMKPDHAHVNYKRERFGDHRVNLTHGEQEEIRRQSNGSRLKEENLAMDHRSPSRFGWHDVEFQTIPYDLPDLPENVAHWLNDCWRRYERTREQIIHQLYEMVQAHKAEGDNRRTEVKAQRSKEQEQMTREIWNTLWKWWVEKRDAAKAAAKKKAKVVTIDGVDIEFVTITEAPYTQAMMTSLKMIIEIFRKEMGFENPVMRFWTTTKCTECDLEVRMLLPLDTENAICKPCGELTARVLSYEWIRIMERTEPDWWKQAEDLRSRINHLYTIGGELTEIRPLEKRLHWIEVERIKFDCVHMLFYGEYPDVDERYV